MKPKVSVVLPTYGDPTFLPRSIESVRRQSYAHWELIVVDDNEPAAEARRSTEAMMAAYRGDSRILYIRHDRNKSGAAARNTGIARAAGEYIAFLDSDDEYAPRRLERCLAALEGAPDPWAGVYTGCEIWQGGRLIRRRIHIKSGNFLPETLAAAFPLSSGSNLFLRAGVVRELGGFDENFRRHQDYEFLVRYFRRYSLLALPEVLLTKHELGANRPNLEAFQKTKRQYLEKYRPELASLRPAQRAAVYAEHALGLQAAALAEGRPGAFCRFTAQALARRPVYTLIRTAKLFGRRILGRSGRVEG